MQNQKKKFVNAVWTPTVASPAQVNALWNPDTTATGHVSSTLNMLHQSKSTKNHPGIIVVNGATGNSKFLKQGKEICVNDIAIVSSISRNLLSVYRLCNDNNISYWFDQNSVAIVDLQTKKVLARGGVSGGMYELNLESSEKKHEANAVDSVPMTLWHYRLGHVSEKLTK